jgi:hypothetical protein
LFTSFEPHLWKQCCYFILCFYSLLSMHRLQVLISPLLVCFSEYIRIQLIFAPLWKRHTHLFKKNCPIWYGMIPHCVLTIILLIYTWLNMLQRLFFFIVIQLILLVFSSLLIDQLPLYLPKSTKTVNIFPFYVKFSIITHVSCLRIIYSQNTKSFFLPFPLWSSSTITTFSFIFSIVLIILA